MKTAAFDDLSVVGVLRQCVHTETGWRGIDETGTIIEVRRRIEGVVDGPIPPARMPADNRIIKWENGRPVGVLLLKRKRRSAA